MLNLASKTFIALSLGALVAGAAYGVVIGDRNGALLLVGAGMVAALLVAISVTLVGADAPPHITADAPGPERRAAYTADDAARSSGWPLVAALAGVGVAGGAAAGARWLTVALVALLVPTVGWLAQVWREHPSFSPAVRARVSDRLVAPLAMPALALLTALFIAVMVSRLLLAVPEQLSTVGAIAVAIGVLLTLAFISNRPSIGSSALVGVAVIALVGLVAVGAGGARAGERSFEHRGEGPPTFTVVARDIKFSLQKLTVPARQPVFVKFVNRDVGTYHDVAFYTSTDADRKPLFAGKPIPGGTEQFRWDTPDAGTYAFVCDFHPTMTGVLVVTPK